MCHCEDENLFVICKARGDPSLAFDICVIDAEWRVLAQVCRLSGQRAAFAIPPGAQYMVIATPCEQEGQLSPGSACSWVTLSPGCGCTKFFLFTVLPRPCLVPVSFRLTDAYYENLPIEKGELYLWPSM